MWQYGSYFQCLLSDCARIDKTARQVRSLLFCVCVAGTITSARWWSISSPCSPMMAARPLFFTVPSTAVSPTGRSLCQTWTWTICFKLMKLNTHVHAKRITVRSPMLPAWLPFDWVALFKWEPLLLALEGRLQRMQTKYIIPGTINQKCTPRKNHFISPVGTEIIQIPTWPMPSFELKKCDLHPSSYCLKI